MTPMFNLFEMLQQSQNGAAIDAVAKQFGLTPRQAENAVDVLLPAFTLALQRQMQNPQLWPTLFSAMQPPAPASAPQAFEAAGRAFAHDSMRQGADLMQSLFGTSDLSKQVAVQAAAASGLPTTILQQMMPALGTMLVSGMLKTFSQEGLAGVITAMQRGLPGGTATASEPAAAGPFTAYLDMMATLMGARAGGTEPEEPHAAAPPEAQPESEPQANALPNPFNPQEMAGYFAQMVALASGAAAKAGPESPAAGDGEVPAPAAAPAADDTAAAAGAGGGAEDAPEAAVHSPLEMLFETGREVQEQYLRGLQELFERSVPEPGQTA